MDSPAPPLPPASPLSEPPMLASLAAWTAILSVLINRGLLRTVGETMSRGELLRLRRLASVPQNLATILAFVALTLAVQQLVARSASNSLWGRPSASATVGRAGVSGFAGIFLASVFLALIRPSSEMSTELVLMTVISGLLLGILVGLGALRLPLAGASKVALGVATLGALAAFTDLILSTIGWILRSHELTRLAGSLRQLGEMAYLALPFAVWASTRLGEPGTRNPRRWTLVIGSIVGLGWALFAWKGALGTEFANVFYGTTHLDLFVERAPLAYALPLGVGLGLALETQISGLHRQAGTALLCLLAAGVAPRSTEQVLYLALGLVLLSRWTISARSRA